MAVKDRGYCGCIDHQTYSTFVVHCQKKCTTWVYLDEFDLEMGRGRAAQWSISDVAEDRRMIAWLARRLGNRIRAMRNGSRLTTAEDPPPLALRWSSYEMDPDQIRDTYSIPGQSALFE